MTTAAMVVVVALARRAASLQTGQWCCRLQISLAFSPLSPLGTKNPALSSRGQSRVVTNHGGSSRATSPSRGPSHATSRAASRSHARSRVAIHRANHQSRAMSLRCGVANLERSN